MIWKFMNLFPCTARSRNGPDGADAELDAFRPTSRSGWGRDKDQPVASVMSLEERIGTKSQATGCLSDVGIFERWRYAFWSGIVRIGGVHRGAANAGDWDSHGAGSQPEKNFAASCRSRDEIGGDRSSDRNGAGGTPAESDRRLAAEFSR